MPILICIVNYMVPLELKLLQKKASHFFLKKEYFPFFPLLVFLSIIIIIIILLIIKVIKVKFEIYEWLRATSNGAGQTHYCQWRLCVKQCKRATVSGAFAHPDYDPLPLDQHLLLPKTPMSVTRYLKTSLSVQRCAAIRKFQNLLLLLLLLII
jgi:hypothetical protein